MPLYRAEKGQLFLIPRVPVGYLHLPLQALPLCKAYMLDMRWWIAKQALSAELAIIISYPTSASGITVLLKTPTKNREFFPTLFVKTTDFQLVFNFEQTRTVTMFGEHGIQWFKYHDGQAN